MPSNGRLFQILATTILQAVEFSRLRAGFVANHPRIEGVASDAESKTPHKIRPARMLHCKNSTQHGVEIQMGAALLGHCAKQQLRETQAFAGITPPALDETKVVGA